MLIVRAAHGVLDNLPWVCCLYRGTPKPNSLARSAVLVCVIAAARVVSVVNQPPSTTVLFSFAPTDLSMCFNAALGCFYAILLGLTMCPGSCRGAPPLIRPQCRVWLVLLAVTYTGASLGYLLFLTLDIPATTAMWVGEGALYLYAVGVGPALYLTFARERVYWRLVASGASESASLDDYFFTPTRPSRPKPPDSSERLLRRHAISDVRGIV